MYSVSMCFQLNNQYTDFYCCPANINTNTHTHTRTHCCAFLHSVCSSRAWDTLFMLMFLFPSLWPLFWSCFMNPGWCTGGSQRQEARQAEAMTCLLRGWRNLSLSSANHSSHAAWDLTVNCLENLSKQKHTEASSLMELQINQLSWG